MSVHRETESTSRVTVHTDGPADPKLTARVAAALEGALR